MRESANWLLCCINTETSGLNQVVQITTNFYFLRLDNDRAIPNLFLQTNAVTSCNLISSLGGLRKNMNYPFITLNLWKSSASVQIRTEEQCVTFYINILRPKPSRPAY